MDLSFAISNPLFELAIILVIATVFAYIARLIKQPLVPAYLIAGVVLGPLVLGIVHDMNLIKIMSEIGIMFLLFIVGLEMNLEKLKKVGFVSAIVGILQVGLTFIFGYAVSFAFGLGMLNSIFLGLVAAFSSTMIVVKLLSDREEIDTLHGRLIVGILLIQDIIVIIAMPFLSSMSGFSIAAAGKMLTGTIALAVIAFLFNKLAMKRIFSFAARSDELLFLLSLSIGFLFAIIAAICGFSIAIGAFIAGLMMANLPYHFNILGRVAPLKDFFSTIFFVSLGMQIVSINLKEIVWPLLALLVVVILVKPLIVIAILSIFGYAKRTTFMAGSLLGQISEFSLILVIAATGFLNSGVFSITIALALVTITLTSYVLKYDDRIYNFLSGYLSVFEKLSVKEQHLEFIEKGSKPQIILIGCDRMGTVILRTLVEKLKKGIFVIDSNPEIISHLISRKIPCMYGVIENLEVLKRVNFRDAKFVISTVPDIDDNMVLIEHAKKVNKTAVVIVTADSAHAAAELYDAKADYVIVPKIISGEVLSGFLERHLADRKYIAKMRERHMAHIKHLNDRAVI
ncbi:MAG TPA: hypothetical protein HA362_04245 [Nanoarchaeota archaeon]|nr:hypothetical protein [Nanoarchaeota archaeon]